ncbi:MAG: hypothetical protein QME96_03545 [Myxococcota bacterium]|nr:hypothetical protein [Myxococcota bacterium]
MMGTLEKEIRGVVERAIVEVGTKLRGLPLSHLPAALEAIERVLPSAAARRAPKAIPAGKPEAPAKPAAKKAASRPKRRITKTPRLVAARKIQGRYIGTLRNFGPKDRIALRALAKAKGVPAAVAEMDRRLAKAGAARTSTAPAKPAPKAAPKKKVMPASYYRCAHRGCTKNWYVKGRPHCGEHAKLHGKRKA